MNAFELTIETTGNTRYIPRREFYPIFGHRPTGEDPDEMVAVEQTDRMVVATGKTFETVNAMDEIELEGEKFMIQESGFTQRSRDDRIYTFRAVRHLPDLFERLKV